MLGQPLLLISIRARGTLRRNLLHVRHCRNLFANFPRDQDTLEGQQADPRTEGNLFLGSDLEGKGRSDPDLGMPAAGWVTDAPTLALPLLLATASL